MTIKRRIFFSNIRILLLFFAGLFVVGFIGRILLIQFNVISEFDPDQTRRMREMFSQEEGQNKENWEYIMTLVFFVFFIVIAGIINNVLTYRLTKNIVSSLDPLSEGVRQIHGGNLAWRINYGGGDEFRPVCDAFNEMAARLEESEARRQKDESNRRELIAGISHDLRTPLTAVKGYLEGLETGAASTPEKREQYFAALKARTADLEHIIEQLFLFSKLDMDEFPLTLRRVDICRVVSDMAEETALEYESRGLAVRLAAMPEGLFVQADTMWLRNVVVNIFENSVRYKTKEKGAVEVTAEASDGAGILRFTDNGPGVPKEALPKLFDVFYRADPSRSKKGSGLGLAISAKIIERMGGAVHAELPPEGGLAIVIRLPLEKEEA